MTTDDMDIVSALRAALADRVGKERFELWFGTSTRLEVSDDALIINAPNRFFRDWLSSSFRKPLEESCEAILGRCPALRFLVDPSLPEPSAASKSPQPPCALLAAAKPPAPLSAVHDTIAAAPSSPTVSSSRFGALDTFVTGPSNRLARAAAETILQRPGQISPLLIHGPTSVGKTHLLQGIWTAARRNRLGPGAVYLTAEQFTTYYVEALRGSGLPSFRQKYRGVPLLILDDLQFFRGKRSTLVELLYTVDTILREGRQIVFAADRPLSELSDLGAELISRLKSGVACAIEPPEHATRLGIVEQLARRMEISVPKSVQQFIAARLTSHARELSGALCRLQATSEAWGEPITLGMAEECLAEMIRHGTRIVRLPDIQKAICDLFGIEPDSLRSGHKGRHASHPRMLAMWLARKHTRAALSEIGEFFGRRSHSTVVSAQKRVDHWLADGATLDLADHPSTIDDAIRRVEQTLLAG